jgi:hypothetical protein
LKQLVHAMLEHQLLMHVQTRACHGRHDHQKLADVAAVGVGVVARRAPSTSIAIVVVKNHQKLRGGAHVRGAARLPHHVGPVVCVHEEPAPSQ